MSPVKAVHAASEPGPNSLRDGVRQRIVEEIGRGEFEPGQRLNLASLSRSMGVSVTPIREALTQLQQEGLIRAETNRGFFVPELSLRQLEETYPILSVLEGLAVGSIAKYSGKTIAALRAANARLSSAGGGALEAFDADLAWHRQLIEPCENRTLLNGITRLRRSIASSELAFMRESGHLPDSMAEHEDITGLLESGDHSSAVQALEAHWNRSFVFVQALGETAL